MSLNITFFLKNKRQVFTYFVFSAFAYIFYGKYNDRIVFQRNVENVFYVVKSL